MCVSEDDADENEKRLEASRLKSSDARVSSEDEWAGCASIELTTRRKQAPGLEAVG